MSNIRYNYHESCEVSINKQINMELYASYVYLSMAFHFERDDVALNGAAKFFHKQSAEERDHAKKLMQYQNSRGGRVKLHPINAPASSDWGNLLAALEASLQLEKEVNVSLLELHKLAEKHADGHLSEYLEGFLGEQVDSIKQFADMITRLKRAGPTGLGEHLFDKELA